MGECNGNMYTLRPKTLAVLSQMLNPPKILLSDDGHLRDWRGLAELIGSDVLTIQNFENHPDPFMALFCHSLKNLKIHEVIAILKKMDRFDVIDDSKPLIERDLSLLSESTNSSMEIKLFGNKSPVTINDLEHLKENGDLLQYDAFVLYAKEDHKFLNQVVDKMEGEYGFKLCLKDRDLIAGLPFEHEAVTELITNRCRFVMPIFSPNFLNSEDNKFFVNFTEALGIEKGCRKIVPCVYENCPLPKSISYYSRLDYTKRNQYWDFWEKMKKSLENPSSSKLNSKEELKIDIKEDSSSSLRKEFLESSKPVNSEKEEKEEKEKKVFFNGKNEEDTKSKNWLKRMIKKPKKKKEKQEAAAC